MSGGLEGQLQLGSNPPGIQAHGFGMAGKLGAIGFTGGNVPATLAAAGALAPRFIRLWLWGSVPYHSYQSPKGAYV